MLYSLKRNGIAWIIIFSLFLSGCSRGSQESGSASSATHTDTGVIGDVAGGDKNAETPEKGEKVTLWDNQIHPSVEVCWEKTCALQTYLEAQEKEGKFDLSKTEYFQNRFWNLLNRFKEKDILMKTEEFQQFVKDFNAEYFPCEWKVEICNKKSKYTYDEQNFIWYIFLPRMVAAEFQWKRGGDGWDAESIIQSIRRHYFATYDEKEAMIQVWKDKLRETARKIDLSAIDKKRLKEDKAYYEQVILAPKSGIYDQIVKSVLSPIPWMEKWELLDTTYFALDTFLSKAKELWIDRGYFYQSIGTSEDNFKKLDVKLDAINKTYGLSEKMPYDRYIRHDEIANYVFVNLVEFNSKGDFNKDVLEAKHYLLLQFAFPDRDLYNMPERAAKFRSMNNFLGENLLKYSKYMDDVVKL